jgi:sterol 3beta-glucosyltransferase
MTTAAPTSHKIALQTWGSDGDVHPFIGLAGALAARGHDVTLAVTSIEPKSYRPFAERLGFRLIEVGSVGADDADMHGLVRKMHALRNPLAQAAFIFDDLLAPGIPAIHQAARSLCAEHDLMIGHFILHPVHGAAEQAGIPYLTLTLNHSAIPTRSSPPVGMPNLGPWLNPLAWKLAMLILERLLRPRINRWRQSCALAPVASFRSVWESSAGNLIAVSPQLCARPSDWAAHQHVCGFFPPPEVSQVGALPADLEAFIASGPAPVYFTFGSMLAVPQDGETLIESVRLMVEAASIAGCRAIVQAPWSQIGDVHFGATVFRVERAPHLQVFPRCTAVVHHGGAGTTQTSLLCGKPSVVVAHIVDQFFWGRELARAGVAPSLIDRRRATPRKLGKAVREVLDSPAMQEKARVLGRDLANEDGLARAVALVESFPTNR